MLFSLERPSAPASFGRGNMIQRKEYRLWTQPSPSLHPGCAFHTSCKVRQVIKPFSLQLSFLSTGVIIPTWQGCCFDWMHIKQFLVSVQGVSAAFIPVAAAAPSTPSNLASEVWIYFLFCPYDLAFACTFCLQRIKSIESLYPVIEPASELCLDMDLLEAPFISNKEKTRPREPTPMIFD